VVERTDGGMDAFPQLVVASKGRVHLLRVRQDRGNVDQLRHVRRCGDIRGLGQPRAVVERRKCHYLWWCRLGVAAGVKTRRGLVATS
jgi:hypothetical protein